MVTLHFGSLLNPKKQKNKLCNKILFIFKHIKNPSRDQNHHKQNLKWGMVLVKNKHNNH